MQLALVIALSLHVLAGTFWAGSTFVLARLSGTGSDRLLGFQLVAAMLAIGAGGYLWQALHEGSFGTAEQLLAAGAAAAIVALIIQAAVVGRAIRQMRSARGEDISARSSIAIGQRAAAALLAVATTAMAAARYA